MGTSGKILTDENLVFLNNTKLLKAIKNFNKGSPILLLIYLGKMYFRARIL